MDLYSLYLKDRGNIFNLIDTIEINEFPRLGSYGPALYCAGTRTFPPIRLFPPSTV